MQNKKGFNKEQTIEVLINSVVFAVPTVIFYIQENKLMAALAIMASLFSLYSISLSKSDVKSTILGSISINIIISLFITFYYFDSGNWIWMMIWLLLIFWFVYKLREKILTL